MKFRSGLLALASFFSIATITFIALPALAAANAQEFRLANGLRIIVQEDKRAPTVAHMIWYRIGSMDEHNGTTGVAHVWNT
jgi:zinc protease